MNWQVDEPISTPDSTSQLLKTWTDPSARVSGCMAGSIADWKTLFERTLACLKPGGVLEMQEFEAAFFAMSGPLSEVAPSLSQWEVLVNSAGRKSLKNFLRFPPPFANLCARRFLEKFGKKMNMGKLGGREPRQMGTPHGDCLRHMLTLPLMYLLSP